MIWRCIVILIAFVATLSVSGNASAQTTLKDQAISFAASIEDQAFAVSEEDWLAYEESIDFLPPKLQIDEYQDLAFMYLSDGKPDHYQRLHSKYADLLAGFGNIENKRTQEIIDALELRSVHGDYHAAIARLNELIRSDALNEEQYQRASVALAYALADAGMAQEAKRALQQTQETPQSPQSQVERAEATAYVEMLAGDYPRALLAMQMSARAQTETAIPFDSSEMLSKTMYLLQQSGQSAAARDVAQTLRDSRAEADKRSGQSGAKDRNRSMSDATPTSGAAGAPSSVNQLSTETELDEEAAKLKEYVGNEQIEVPWQLIGWIAAGVVTLAVLFAGMAEIAKRQNPRKRALKPRRERVTETTSEEPQQAKPEPVKEEPEELEVPRFPIRTQTVEDPSSGFLSQFRVLIADDNDTNIELMTEFLELYGLHTYYIARNGEEAWSIAVRAQVDIILMDIQMPKLNGIEATKRIRDNRRGRSIPIIGVTAFSRVVNEDMCLEAGMNGFLTKPVEMDELYETLKKVLSAQSGVFAA